MNMPDEHEAIEEGTFTFTGELCYSASSYNLPVTRLHPLPALSLDRRDSE